MTSASQTNNCPPPPPPLGYVGRPQLDPPLKLPTLHQDINEACQRVKEVVDALCGDDEGNGERPEIEIKQNVFDGLNTMEATSPLTKTTATTGRASTTTTGRLSTTPSPQETLDNSSQLSKEHDCKSFCDKDLILDSRTSDIKTSASFMPSVPRELPSLPLNTPSGSVVLSSVLQELPSEPSGILSVPPRLPSLPPELPSAPPGSPSEPPGFPSVPPGLSSVPLGLPSPPASIPSAPLGLTSTPFKTLSIQLKSSKESQRQQKPEACWRHQTRQALDVIADRPGWRKQGYHYICSLRKTKSLLQVGPTCGFVALKMAFGCDSTKRELRGEIETKPGTVFVTEKGNEKRPESKPVPTVEEMIVYARDKGWTNMGEMFSCVAMKSLVETFIPGASASLVEGAKEIDIIQHLLNGGVALVPYDKDRNMGPCHKGGLKAHWALLVGLVGLVSGEQVDELVHQKKITMDLEFEAEKTAMLQMIQATGPLLLDTKPSDQASSESTLTDITQSTIFQLKRPSLFWSTSYSSLSEVYPNNLAQVSVVALQGKSQKLLFWSLQELLASNCQLNSYPSSKTKENKNECLNCRGNTLEEAKTASNEEGNYSKENELIFPDGDIKAGLCNKLVLLHFSR